MDAVKLEGALGAAWRARWVLLGGGWVRQGLGGGAGRDFLFWAPPSGLNAQGPPPLTTALALQAAAQHVWRRRALLWRPEWQSWATWASPLSLSVCWEASGHRRKWQMRRCACCTKQRRCRRQAALRWCSNASPAPSRLRSPRRCTSPPLVSARGLRAAARCALSCCCAFSQAMARPLMLLRITGAWAPCPLPPPPSLHTVDHLWPSLPLCALQMQVLVYHDLLGMMSHPHHAKVTPKFCKQYAHVGQTIQAAINQYRCGAGSFYDGV